MTDNQPMCGYCELRDAITDLKATHTEGGQGQLHRGPNGEIAAKPACGDCLTLGRHQYKASKQDKRTSTSGGAHYMEGQ